MPGSKVKLGGWLTMLNCVVWLITFLFANGFRSYPAFIEILFSILFYCMTLPFAWVLIIPGLFEEISIFESVVCFALIGVNSFAWGYGLAAMIRHTQKLLAE